MNYERILDEVKNYKLLWDKINFNGKFVQAVQSLTDHELMDASLLRDIKKFEPNIELLNPEAQFCCANFLGARDVHKGHGNMHSYNSFEEEVKLEEPLLSEAFVLYNLGYWGTLLTKGCDFFDTVVYERRGLKALEKYIFCRSVFSVFEGFLKKNKGCVHCSETYCKRCYERIYGDD